jgi:hypothetical protein
MTALHRDWLTSADTEARERVTVLNVRHSLSTALVALRATGRVGAVIARFSPASAASPIPSSTG